MSRQPSSLFEHRYLPPDKVHTLRCEYCAHFYDNVGRCGIIEASEGEITKDGCCRFWWNGQEMADAYPKVELDRPGQTERGKTMKPLDLGRLLTKAEASFVENADDIIGCGDCQFFGSPNTCTLIGKDTVEPEGACALFWRNVRKEAEDDGLHSEFKEPPPEMREAMKPGPLAEWWRRHFG